MYFRDFTVFVLSRSHTRCGMGLSPKCEVPPNICKQNSLLTSSTYLVQVQRIMVVLDYTQWHTPTHQVWLPSTKDRLVAETSTCTTQKIHKIQTSMNPAGLEPAIPASERPQTYTLDHASTAIAGTRFKTPKNAFHLVSLPCESHGRMWHAVNTARWQSPLNK